MSDSSSRSFLYFVWKMKVSDLKVGQKKFSEQQPKRASAHLALDLRHVFGEMHLWRLREEVVQCRGRLLLSALAVLHLHHTVTHMNSGQLQSDITPCFRTLGHLTLERRHLLGPLSLQGSRQAGEQTGRQLLLHLLFVLHLQGAAEEADTRITRYCAQVLGEYSFLKK